MVFISLWLSNAPHTLLLFIGQDNKVILNSPKFGSAWVVVYAVWKVSDSELFWSVFNPNEGKYGPNSECRHF